MSAKLSSIWLLWRRFSISADSAACFFSPESPDFSREIGIPGSPPLV
jgi:hypothetical protein